MAELDDLFKISQLDNAKVGSRTYVFGPCIKLSVKSIVDYYKFYSNKGTVELA